MYSVNTNIPIAEEDMVILFTTIWSILGRVYRATCMGYMLMCF